MNFRARTRPKPRTRFAMKAKPRKTRVKPKRETPRTIHPERSGSGHKRERLHGKAREQRRAEIFARSGGRCEELTGDPIVVVQTQAGPIGIYFSCNRRINSGTYDPSYNPHGMEWSHNRHAANKCDCMACGIASCHDCHVKRHAGGNGKPCPSKKQ
jgi:hypothetical protein